MPYIDINNAKIYFQSSGDGESNQTPIVLIHGSTGDASTEWDSVAPALAKE